MKKGFTLHKEEKDHYLIKHSCGDELKIAKKGLSPQLTEQIKKMACGGLVESPVKKMAEGGEVESPSEDTPQDQPKTQAPVNVNINWPGAGTGQVPMNPGRGPNWEAMPEPQSSEQYTGKYVRGVPEVNAPEPKPKNVAVNSNQNVPMPAAQMPAQQQSNPMADVQGAGLQQLGNIQKQELSGMKGAADLQGKVGQQNFQALGEAQNSLYNMQSNLEYNLNRIQKHVDDTTAEVHNGQIDPTRVWNNKTTGEKVLSTIGLILGGAGSHWTGGRNLALDQLNKYIDDDIGAQKTALGQKKTALEGYLKEYGNVKDASAALRLNLLAMTDAQLAKNAAQYAGPLAQQQYQVASAQLKQMMLKEAMPLAMSQAALNQMKSQSGGSPEQMIRMSKYMGASDHEVAKMFEEHTKLQGMQKAGQSALEGFDKVNSMVLGGSFSPKQRDAAIEAPLAQLVKDAEGRITPQDVEMIRALFPSRVESNETRIYKRNKLINFLQEKMNSTLLNAYGVPIPKIATAVPR